MFKQFILITSALTLFVTVWVTLIFQFDQSEKLTGHAKNESTEVRAIPLPSSISTESTTGEWVYNEECSGKVEVICLENKNQLQDKLQENGQHPAKTIDLRNYDFSDISSLEGVPIEGILNKLGLAE